MVNSAPTAGVPAKSRPVCGTETGFSSARRKLGLRSSDAPRAGVMVKPATTARATMSATQAGGRESHRVQPGDVPVPDGSPST